ncbi:hypothetical protein [Pseudomonas oryzihabitans]|uniref:hypothetical protein n=1 Tax=Pseudomonas oryzihabitans TaxID=47885 RepID=UPI0028955B49|nr:hypothetical protein [Pseudomonas oryzihabitans]MDT3723009.1 hypothetical protein [Pseudomonas oryzihabitans]
MKLWQRTKKAAKFSFVSMPLSILGWRNISNNHEYLKDLVSSIRNPHCPMCEKGVMHVSKDASPDSNALYPWTCSAGCGFAVFTQRDQASINQVLLPIITQKGRAQLNGMSEAKQEQLIRSHTRQSRMFWILAAMCFLLALYDIASAGLTPSVIGTVSVAFPFSILAIKWSYRAWQVRTGTLYVKGAFKKFFLRGLWLPGEKI